MLMMQTNDSIIETITHLNTTFTGGFAPAAQLGRPMMFALACCVEAPEGLATQYG